MKALICSVMSVITILTSAFLPSSQPIKTSAQSMIVLENITNRVLYEHNADRRLPMASTTKIVTAITVIEHCDDLNRVVKVPAKAVGVEGSSIYLQADEELKIIDLLHGLMLQSGNDCAVALALTVSGGIDEFAALMNETAKRAGAENSNFVNPHGLHDDNHYTTARDLARIASYAMKNPTFEKIVATKRYTMPWKGRDYDRVVLNKNKILDTFDGGDGIKTGFTKKAGRCLVSSAKRNGMRVICVVLNCGPMFEECGALMEQAFKEYSLKKICDKDTSFQVPVKGGRAAFVECAPSKDVYYPLKDGEENLVNIVAHTDKTLAAPAPAGAEAGKIEILLENRLLFEEKLFTINSVDAPSYLDRLNSVITQWRAE